MIKLKDILREIGETRNPYAIQVNSAPNTKEWEEKEGSLPDYTAVYNFKTDSSVPYVIFISRKGSDRLDYYLNNDTVSLYTVSFKVDHANSSFEKLPKPEPKKGKEVSKGQDDPAKFNYVANLEKGEMSRVISTAIAAIRLRLKEDTEVELVKLEKEWTGKMIPKKIITRWFPTDKTITFEPAARGTESGGADPKDERRKKLYMAYAQNAISKEFKGGSITESGGKIIVKLGKFSYMRGDDMGSLKTAYEKITGTEVKLAAEEPSDDKA